MLMADVGDHKMFENGITTIQNSNFGSNTYLIVSKTTKDAVVIDPGLDWHALDSAIELQGAVPKIVISTHGHFDHIGCCWNVMEKYGAELFLHVFDEKIAKASNFLMMALKIRHRITTPIFDHLVEGGSEVAFDGSTIRIIHTPGHTPGSCVLFFRDFMFSGDTLFTRGFGLSQLPGENKEELRRSLLALVNEVPPDTIVLPGHGGPGVFGTILQSNVALRNFLDFPASNASSDQEGECVKTLA